MRDVSLTSMGLTYLLIAAFIAASAWYRLQIGAETFWASLRGTVQLVLVSFVISFIFKFENTALLMGVMALMCAVATGVAAGRVQKVKGIWKLIAFAIFTCVTVTMAFLVAIGAIDWKGQYVIPLAGMLIGQTMNSCTLFLDRFLSEVQTSRLMVESNLSLGATSSQAVKTWLTRAVRTNSMPTLDMLKTLGIIHLPGMMAGLIIAGLSPLVAVKYQLIVVFMLTFTFGLSSLILALLIHRFIFNRDDQLKHW